MKISVIVPVYRVEKYLPECVDSLIGQTLDDIEIILVDDGSPDNCGKMCDDYADRHENIKVIHKENGGLSSARNAALDIAQGKYVSFVDSDDYVAAQMLEKLYNSIEKEKAQYAACGFYRFKDGEPPESFAANLPSGCYDRTQILEGVVLPLMGNPERVCLKKCNGFSYLGIYSRDIIEKNQIRFRSEREVFHEDEVFLFTYLKYVDSACFVDEPLYYYRFNASSLTHVYRPNLWEMSIALIGEYRNFAKEYGVEEEARRRIDMYWLSYVVPAVRKQCFPGNGIKAGQRIKNIRDIFNNSEVRRIVSSGYPIFCERFIINFYLKLIQLNLPLIAYAAACFTENRTVKKLLGFGE